MVRQFERDLPALLHFFALPPHLEVRRRTRPMVVFSKVESVERIICAIFSRFNEDWKNHALHLYKQLDVTRCETNLPASDDFAKVAVRWHRSSGKWAKPL